MPSDSFVHLHVHTEYSMLDGAARVDDLVGEAARQEMPALAITDHGNMFGAFDFCKPARAQRGQADHRHGGLRHARHQPVRAPAGAVGQRRRAGRRVGCGRLHPHDAARRDNRGHAQPVPAVLAASMEGYFYKPRIDRELLERLRQGPDRHDRLPVGRGADAGCGWASTTRRAPAAAEFRDIFGAGNYFCEMMDHGLDIERRVHDDLLRLAKDLELPLVATNDLHYTHAAGRRRPRGAALRAVRVDADDPNRFKFDADGYYLKTPRRCARSCASYPEACDNTLLIAERCEVDVHRGRAT